MIPKSDWLQIYVGLKLVRFYAKSIENGSIEKARLEYQDFLQTDFPADQEKNHFDSVPNLISFIYLLLVRSHDIMKQYIEPHREEIFLQIGNLLNLKNENDLLGRYHMIIMVWNKNKNNDLQYLVGKIRNSISHFRYKITGPNILLTDGYMKNGEFNQNFRVSLPVNKMLNLTIEFVSIMSDVIKDKNLIDWEK